jgi:hypothetical protein
MNIGHLVYFKKLRSFQNRQYCRKNKTGLFIGVLLGHLKPGDPPPTWTEYWLLLKQINLVTLTDVELCLGKESALKLSTYVDRKYHK